MGLGLSKYFPCEKNRSPSSQFATAQELSKVNNVLLHRDLDNGHSTASASRLNLELSIARSEDFSSRMPMEIVTIAACQCPTKMAMPITICLL